MHSEDSLLTFVKYSDVSYLSKLNSGDGSQIWSYTLPLYSDSNDPIFLDYTTLDAKNEMITTI